MAQTYYRYRAGDKPVSSYKLIRKLGEGGFGEVWQASAPGGAEVALKFIDLTGQQGFREFKSLRLVKKVRHSNLIPLHGFWLKNEDGTLIDESDVTWSQLAPSVPADPSSPPPAGMATAVFTAPVELIIAMGLGEKSLYDRLRECTGEGLGGIPADELLEYMEDAAKGIDYLNRPIHNMGHGPVPIVHSDVKPHNILIVGDSAAVCDFGLAHAVEALRKACAAPLTLAYAAPESFRGKPCDKSDLYSLAITYVELRTGTLPFPESLTGYEVMTAHVQGQLDFSRLTPAETAVIRKATAPLPQDRWRTCREMIVELRKSLRLTPTGDSEPVPIWQTPQAPAAAPFSNLSDYRGTIAPPGQISGDTSRPQGVTPPEPQPLVTHAQRTPDAKVVPAPLQRPVQPRRPLPTAAKLFISLLLLGAVGAVGGYFYLNPPNGNGKVNDGSDVAENTEDEAEKKAKEQAEKQKRQELEREKPKLAFEENLAAQDYKGALDILNRPDVFNDPEKTAKLQLLQTGWRTRADKTFLSAARPSEYRDAAADYAALGALPSPNAPEDLKLLEARALLAAGDRTVAQQHFKQLQAPPQRETPRDRTFFLTKLLIDADAVPGFENLDELHQVWKEQHSVSTGSDGDIWAARKFELAQLDKAKSEILDRWLATAASRSGDQNGLAELKENGLSALQKVLHIDKDNVDAQVLKAELHLALDQGTQFAHSVKERLALDKQPTLKRFRDGARILDASYHLRTPQTDPKTLQATLNLVPELMAQFKDSRAMLAGSVIELANRSDEFLPAAVQSLRSAAEEPQSELKPQFAQLLARRIHKRFAEDAVDQSKAEQLVKDCQFIRAAQSDPDETVRACHAESLLTLNREGALQALEPAGTSPYYLFVKARALSQLPDAAAESRAALASLFAMPPTPELRQGGRVALAFEALDSLVQSEFPATELNIATALTPRVAASFTPLHDILANAQIWSDTQTKLSEKARAQLALASWWNTPRKDQAARALSAELVAEWRTGRDEELDPALVYPVYYTYLAAHRGAAEKPTQESILGVADRLMSLSKAKKLDSAQAQALYRTAFVPFEPLAKELKNDALFAHTAELVAAFPSLDWGIADAAGKKLHISDTLDRLYTNAIAFAGGEKSSYHLSRGRVRLNRKPFNLQAVLEDAKELDGDKELRIDGQLLRGQAYFFKSREEPTNPARLAALNQALEALQNVVDTGGKRESTDDEEAERLLLLSYVHLERRNFKGLDAGAVDDFETAAKYAEEAQKLLRGTRSARAYSAAGNAYEDLAWYTAKDVAKNYKQAVENFGFAVRADRDSALAHMNLGRCYYKMAAVSGVAPPGLGTLQGIIAKAEDELVQASDLAKGQNAETHYWLAKVRQVRRLSDRASVEQAKTMLNDKEFHAADSEMIRAVELAVQQDLPDSALRLFVVELAESVLLHPSFHSNDSAVRKTARIKVNARIDELKRHNLSRTAGVDMEQEIKLLRARATRLIDTDVAALRELDPVAAELRKTPIDRTSGSDAKIMEFRFSIYPRLPTHERPREVIDAWIKDAIWYATLPYTTRRKPAAPVLDAARTEAENFKPNLFVEHERDWLKAAILSSPFDKRAPDWYKQLLVSYTLQVRTAGADDAQRAAAARTRAAEELDDFSSTLQSRNRGKEAKTIKDLADEYRKATKTQAGTGARTNAKAVSQRKG